VGTHCLAIHPLRSIQHDVLRGQQLLSGRGPYYWTVELHFDPATGQVNDALRDQSAASPLPIAFRPVAEIRLKST